MKQCSKCGKTSQMGGKRKLLRGHYNPTNWSRKYPNLQWVRLNGERVRVCTQCIKTVSKAPTTKAAKATKEKTKETVTSETAS